MTNGCWAGIDPGLHGAIAIIRPDGTAIAFEMPSTPKQLARIFNQHVIPAKVDFCLIENLHALPTKHRGSHSSWVLAENRGVLIGMLEIADIKYDSIEPRSWQKSLGVVARQKAPKGHGALLNYIPEESYGQFKKRLMGYATKLFPGMDVNENIADALLLAEVCRRIHGGYLGKAIL
jgi:hypothetical protein